VTRYDERHVRALRFHIGSNRSQSSCAVFGLRFHERFTGTTVGSAASFAFGLGMLEAFGVYPIIGTARAPSVQATRIVMHIGYLLLAIQFVFLLVPETTHRAFSVQIPFSQSLEWIALATLLLSGYLLGGATWVVWDRWRQTSAVVLEIPTWTRPSLQSWVLVLGFAFATPGFILNSILPSVSLVLFSVGAVLLLVGILPRKTKEGPRVQTTDTSTTSELRKTAYAEKSSLGKRACELILQKYGRRRVFAVCMWGDETENSQPYYGLNLLVVVRDGLRIPAQHYLLNGLEVSVYYWEESAYCTRREHSQKSGHGVRTTIEQESFCTRRTDG